MNQKMIIVKISRETLDYCGLESNLCAFHYLLVSYLEAR